jgi:50S ribosomal subunit-associated GTPase HflX
MAKTRDEGSVTVEEHADVVTLSRNEWEAMQQRLTELEHFADGGGANPVPAVEEGPHLQDPDIREGKLAQIRAAAEQGNLESFIDADLPGDMADLLQEAGV